MYKLGGKKKLGRKASHRKALITNQIRSLYEKGYVETTTPKAKVLKANANSLIHKVNNSTDALTLKRDLITLMGSEALVEKVMKYSKNKEVGVVILKTGFRSGDNAEVSRIELINYQTKKKVTTEKKANSEKKTEAVDEVKKETQKPQKKDQKNLGGNLSKSIKNKLPGNKEKARSRSGL
jgi:large subunit ribosomal protein L17